MFGNPLLRIHGLAALLTERGHHGLKACMMGVFAKIASTSMDHGSGLSRVDWMP